MPSLSTQLPPAPSPEPVFRLSVDQYHAMIDAGVLDDDDPVELLEGILVFKMPKKPRHRFVVRKLVKAIEAMLPTGYFIQSQEPITLSNSEPEPDACVVRGSDDDFTARHPGPDDVPLVIEVADATLRRDRGMKLRAYARAEIAAYWIVDLAGRSVETYASPDAHGQLPSYRHKRMYKDSAMLPLDLDGRRIGQIAVRAILP